MKAATNALVCLGLLLVPIVDAFSLVSFVGSQRVVPRSGIRGSEPCYGIRSRSTSRASWSALHSSTTDKTDIQALVDEVSRQAARSNVKKVEVTSEKDSSKEIEKELTAEELRDMEYMEKAIELVQPRYVIAGKGLSQHETLDFKMLY